MSVQSYLQSLGTAGGIMGKGVSGDLAQLALGTSGQDVSNWGLMKQKSPLFFAELLREASAPGGALSDLHTQRAFASDVSGIMAGERLRRSEGLRGMQQAGFGPMMAARSLFQDPLQGQREIAGARGMRQTELTENIFGAQQLMANVLQAAEARKQQIALAAKSRSMQRDQADDAMMSGLFGDAAGLGMAAMMFPCYLAREVYGPESPKWGMFFFWKEMQAPKWFKRAYDRWSKLAASVLRKAPVLKPAVRRWMDRRIASLG